MWAEYSIRTPETPYRLSINGLLTAIGHFRCCRWPISWIFGPKCENKSQNDQNQGLKGSKIKLSAIVSRIFNYKTWTPYRLSINGLLTAIYRFRCCRWHISWIFGPKCEKNSQNYQYQGLKGYKIKISAIVSIIFN